jgi:hypothetical protein
MPSSSVEKKSYTFLVQSGDQYAALVLSEEDFDNRTLSELGTLLEEMRSRLEADSEPTTHISHVRKFLEEQAELHKNKKL